MKAYLDPYATLAENSGGAEGQLYSWGGMSLSGGRSSFVSVTAKDYKS